MYYYVIEHQVRTDGLVNATETARSTFALALNLYYERVSKLVVDQTYPSAHVMLVDQNLKVERQIDIVAGEIANKDATTEAAE